MKRRSEVDVALRLQMVLTPATWLCVGGTPKVASAIRLANLSALLRLLPIRSYVEGRLE
jgi:hypothetical protein